ncbi:hypothetical protein LTR85_006902 [Meristemomyces frigidus]|nr:hypothetical protein LTR85_006902 [Meristemomyces frigidus]
MADKHTATASFFKLPGELRNRIYRLHLAGPAANGVIKVDRRKFAEPTLLLASRQIRYEALPLYYGENSFILRVASYNSTLPLRWTQKLARYENLYNLSHVRTEVREDGYAHWANLMLWLQRIHSGAVRWAPTETEGDDDREGLALDVMFRQVEQLRGLPWTHVEGIMGGFRRLLSVAFDGQWAEETPLGEEHIPEQMRY